MGMGFAAYDQKKLLNKNDPLDLVEVKGSNV